MFGARSNSYTHGSPPSAPLPGHHCGGFGGIIRVNKISYFLSSNFLNTVFLYYLSGDECCANTVPGGSLFRYCSQQFRRATSGCSVLRADSSHS